MVHFVIEKKFFGEQVSYTLPEITPSNAHELLLIIGITVAVGLYPIAAPAILAVLPEK